MKETGKILLSSVEDAQPSHFEIVTIDPETKQAETIFSGVLGDACCSIFARAFANSIIQDGTNVYIVVNPKDVDWVLDNLAYNEDEEGE